ncbi:GumC family protein [Methylomonas rhizoryzae]|uniref:GumC family protein n=1 Tax=Methylomonas rhizoryzae TaxID=2608981 RepID=UPI001232AC7F|nr:hypothetical protein [Methylomonas rhizoryzae]
MHEQTVEFRPVLRNTSRISRSKLFFAVFLISLAVSQTAVFMQTPQYRSSATLLTTSATDLDQASPAADLQHLGIQTEILLGSAIMEATVERLQEVTRHAESWEPQTLRRQFSVSAEPDTNLLHLYADGPEPKRLELALDAWIASYLKVRGDATAENSDKLAGQLHGQLERTERQIAEQRRRIEQFGMQHNILSAESGDNQAHARLQGLNKALNDALAAEVGSKAKLDTLSAAISEGRPVVAESDSQAMAVLLQQAEKLRDQMAEIEGRFTADYIALNPNLNRVREQLAEIERKIAAKSEQGQHMALQEAQNAYLAAKQSVASLKAQLNAHKQAAAEYASGFSEQQAMQQDLANLETVAQGIKQRLADIDIKQRQTYPQVEVVSWASLPDRPIGPDYPLEAGWAAGGSFALALTVVLLWEFLRRAEQPEIPTAKSLGWRPPAQAQPALEAAYYPAQNGLAGPTFAALPAVDGPTEMSRNEVLALYRGSEPPLNAVVALLCNGLSLAEIVSLSPDCLNAETLMIMVPGQRNLPMTAAVAHLCRLGAHFTEWPRAEALDSLLCSFAIDFGLPTPQVNAEAIRHTYLLYLVRQGIKLTDLNKIAGALSSERLQLLRRYSPALAGLPFQAIDLDFIPPA